MEKTMITCRECGRTLSESNFKSTRWGGKSHVCNACAAAKMVASKKRNAATAAADTRKLRLADFTPRELMKELADRGYEGTLTFTEVKKIDITNF